MTIGQKDVFERVYMEKFRQFASHFGEFVHYERDRGARDIGLHLVKKLSNGQEKLASAFCWFQMKGMMEKTLTKEKFIKSRTVELSLKVDHLKYWFLQPNPTYLAVYVESVDIFLVQNMKKYIDKRWGKGILTLQQKTVTVEVPTNSVLDEQAFYNIMVDSDIDEWSRILDQPSSNLKMCRRDYLTIYNIGTAEERGVECRMIIRDWISKSRIEIYIEEKSVDQEQDAEWKRTREHWQASTEIDDLEDAYPYLNFLSSDDYYDEDDESNYCFTFSNGNSVVGVDCSREYYYFDIGIELNEVGKQMLDWVKVLLDAKLIELQPGGFEYISVAPWHKRAI